VNYPIYAITGCGLLTVVYPHSFGELERIIQEAQEEGAEVVVGGQSWRHPYVEDGMYFEATVVANVAPGMEIAQQERASSRLLGILHLKLL
jgi:acyl-CoA reductase-like NAD-dependent aldehyde dehydrogenase